MYLKFIITLLILAMQGESILADENELRLYRDLTSNYGIPIRPSQNVSEPNNIFFTLLFLKVYGMSQETQTLKTGWWILMHWNDYKLKWNESEYGGIKKIKIPAKHIWIPDINLHNNVDPAYEDSVTNTLATVYNTGKVEIAKGGIFSSFCVMDVTYFPFDIQTCYIIWLSGTYSSNKIDFILEKTKMINSSRDENDEIDLLSLTSHKGVFTTAAIKRTLPYIKCTLKLRRKSLTYVFNFILPCSLISAVGLLVFFVPSLSGEKITLGVSSVLSMAVFLMKIKDSLPSSDKTPILSLYYVSSMCLITFATGLSILNINMYYRGESGDTISKAFKRIVNILLGVFSYSRVKDSTNEIFMKHFWENQAVILNNTGDTFPTYPFSLLQRDSLKAGNINEIGKQYLAYTILRFDDMLTYQESLEKENEENQKLMQEWKHASTVLDRFFLIVFTSVTSILTIQILFCTSS